MPPASRPTLRALWALVLALLALVGCEDEGTKTEALEVVDTSGPVVRSGSSTEVWSATNAWMDTDTAAAKKPGLAWPANSGLTWEQKYQRWVQSLEVVPGSNGSSDTIAVKTPYANRTLPGPTLECAEVSIFLRVAFASWYHLPFFVKGWDAANKRYLFAGHFGFVSADGSGAAQFPAFKTKYKDFESTWKEGSPWPTDTVLRSRRLASDDTVEFLTGPNGEEVGAGAYFDEVFLNKRVGHFMRLVLLYFGSVNLADGSNLYHLEPGAIAAGDVLLERWQKKGIGHTIPVFRVDEPVPGKLAVDVVSGSMPRRQPKYEDALAARRYFVMEETGGEGTATDGTPYAKLGGGIRRWRTPIAKSGRWHNVVSLASKPHFIADSELDRIAARPAQFDELLISGSPSEQKAALLGVIDGAREHLLKYPASCSARDAREKAFTSLYAIAGSLGTTAQALDEELRTIDDHVFAPLVYDQSKTCCWNSTTSAMADIVLDYARVERETAEAQGTCVEPTVFRSREDGYAVWRDHAKALGREADWLAWSEDEPCAQRDVAQDTESAFDAAPWCAAP
jgi:hypothetical protein